jgi:hypothetical protein
LGCRFYSVCFNVEQIPLKLTLRQCIERIRGIILESLCNVSKATSCFLNCLQKTLQHRICFNTRLPRFPLLIINYIRRFTISTKCNFFWRRFLRFVLQRRLEFWLVIVSNNQEQSNACKHRRYGDDIQNPYKISIVKFYGYPKMEEIREGDC